MEAEVAGGPVGRVERHVVEVVGGQEVTPWYRRLDCAGRGLLPRLCLAPGSYLWLHVPAPGSGGQSTVERAYTIVRPDLAADRFSLDVVLHDPPGPASAWAAEAAAGTTVAVSEPPYHFAWPERVEAALLVGDAAAVPALGSVLAALPAGLPATVLVAEPRPERDQLPLPERPDTTVRWLEAVTAADLAAAAPAPATGWLWAAGERGLAKSARAFARAAGWPRERQHVQTYWVARA